MEDIQAALSVNYLSDVMYEETSMQLILQNIFGLNYTNFNFSTAGGKVILGNSALLINGQIYLIKGGLDITDVLASIPGNEDNQIYAFVIYDYEFDDETNSDIVSNMKLSFTDDPVGGSVTIPIGVFTKDGANIRWSKQSDEDFTSLVKEVLAGDVIETDKENGWQEGDIITLPNNALKYARYSLYFKNISNGNISNNRQMGIGTDSWRWGKIIEAHGVFSNGSELTSFVSTYDRFRDEIDGEVLPSNQMKLRYYTKWGHFLTGTPHRKLPLDDYPYMIIAYRY